MPPPSDLEKRVEKLEFQLAKLWSVSTSAYISLLTLPAEVTKEDPDFEKYMKKMSEELDEIFNSIVEGREVGD